MIKGSDLCVPCDSGYDSKGGPPGYSWCLPDNTPPADPSPPPPPPSPPPPPAPKDCIEDEDCDGDDVCDFVDEVCRPPDCRDEFVGCVDTTGNPQDPPIIGACNFTDGTCGSCASSDDCVSPSACNGGTCGLPSNGGDAGLTQCGPSTTCPDAQGAPYCATLPSGGGDYCVPCWLAPNNFCQNGSVCSQETGECETGGSARARRRSARRKP